MSTDKVNYLNVGLMIASTAAAFVIPFELFLFAYAVLGPLHYLTEISWLHDRRYFCRRRWDWLAMAGLAILLLLGSSNALGGQAVAALTPYLSDMIFISFGLALILATTTNPRPRLLATAALLAAAALLHWIGGGPYAVQGLIFAIFIPTLIHVFVFTGAFILFGALKSRSVSGYASLVVFVLCAASFLAFRPDASGYTVSDYVRLSYGMFSSVNFTVLNMLYIRPAPGQNLFTNPASLVLMRFIAFAYLYHYLNWFSKTSIIRWHEVSKTRMAVVLALWLASLGLYARDYALGFRWLYLLSFAHVLLEFPLNHQSFIGIGQQVRQRFAPQPGTVSVGASDR